ncbi:hypothetical protein DM02DRAFT_701819 [Periconia macrospinosa]|uniref:LysR family regulatory protein n=1 Tax=Periconia macrospinosa TaxID=97972 RepID=A0A2V1D1Y3_9PLEO|nr:hypothetical protein DM02DRAFT_701819 [Periconia macrospinosa]
MAFSASDIASHGQELGLVAEPDLVIPLHYFDNNRVFKSITVHAIMVYDEVLNPDKLRSSLSRLIGRDTWQKLAFSANRPAIAYTHVCHNMPKANHPAASRIPNSNSAPLNYPEIVGNAEDWSELCCGADSPRTISDYVGLERPVTGLRVVSFKDTTIINIHWLHIVADAMALKAILDNWVLVLEGRETDIPPVQGFDEDPLRELGLHPSEAFDLAGRELSKWGTASYALRNGHSIALGSKETRTLCIPASFMAKLRETAMQDLREEGKQDLFLTDNDLIVAWFSRLAFSHLPPEKPVTIMQAMSMRRALENDLLPVGKPYISNCLTFTSVLKTKKETESSLGLLAKELRQGINKHGTREQIEAYWSMGRRNAWPLGPIPILFGKANMHHIGYSNWTKAKVNMTDFSAACETKKEAPLYPSFVSQIQSGIAYPDGFVVTGQDSQGNYWLEGYRPAGLWAHVEKQLKANM